MAKELKIKNTALAEFEGKYPNGTKRERIEGEEWWAMNISFVALDAYVSKELCDDDKSCKLEARIGWVFNSSTEKKKDFPPTYEGFLDACKWLDEKRLEFMEILL